MKKLILFALVLAIALSALTVGVSAKAGDLDEWDSTADTSWFDPDKKVFEISTAEQLYGMAILSSMGNTFKGCEIRLTSDVKINSGSADNWSMVPAQYYWEPIGSAKTPFMGTFDGQGHTISGIYVKEPAIGEKGDEFTNKGLFGCVGDPAGQSDACIKNLYIKNSYVGAYRNAAVLVGRAVGLVQIRDVRIEGSYAHAYGDLLDEKTEVTDVNVGGIVGLCDDVFGLSILRCSATKCNFNGCVRVGSIVGGGTGNYMELCDCYSDSTVTAINRAGGIVGHSAIGTVEMTNCMFIGDLYCTGTPNYGGMIGGFRATETSVINAQNCYYAGSYVVYGKPAKTRFGCTEIGVLFDESVYYVAYDDDESDKPSGDDKNGCETAPTRKGPGSFAEFAKKVDTQVWDISLSYVSLQNLPIKETPVETAPETTSAPVTTAAPVETTSAPVTTAAPVETTAAPAETTAAPAETTAAPVETTAAPVETTAAPAETTAAPDTTPAGSDEGDEYKNSVGLILWISVITTAVIAICAVVVVIVVLKKKK